MVDDTQRQAQHIWRERASFTNREYLTDGWCNIKELGTGGLVGCLENNVVGFCSKTGIEGSFELPRGDIAFDQEGFPEDVVDAAIRRTQTDLHLSHSDRLTFNGFAQSITEQKEVERLRERFYKRTQVFGFSIKPERTVETAVNGVHVRFMPASEIARWVNPTLQPIAQSYSQHLSKLHAEYLAWGRIG